MVAVHEHLGLDDPHQLGLLAQSRIARKGVGIRPDRVVARDVLALDREDGSPLREARAQPAILLEALAEPVEALRDRLLARERERLRALVDLDPGDDSLGVERLRERGAVLG